MGRGGGGGGRHLARPWEFKAKNWSERQRWVSWDFGKSDYENKFLGGVRGGWMGGGGWLTEQSSINSATYDTVS